MKQNTSPYIFSPCFFSNDSESESGTCQASSNASDIRKIRIEEFDYPLPDDRIARHPLSQRDACRLIVADNRDAVSHHIFTELPELLPKDSLLIANETKVINARMEFFKSSGGRIEVFILEPFAPAEYVEAFASRDKCIWTCMIGNLKRWKEDNLHKEVEIRDTKVNLTARLIPLGDNESPSASRKVEFSWDNPDISFAEIVEAAGDIPIPPYLKRDSEESDLYDYQTVYSRAEGSVAAPTAGLHFTPQLLERLDEIGIRRRYVTLHVGAGTFQPVKSDKIGEHPMHTESVIVSLPLIKDIVESLKGKREIVAVGTTSVRTIESLPILGYLAMKGADVSNSAEMHVGQWTAYEDSIINHSSIELLSSLADKMEQKGLDMISATTAIMIAPGFKWRVVDRMITNFHQPQSTLLLLVSSFLGATPENYADAEGNRWREIYDEALSEGYRFLSYGDACLFSGIRSQELGIRS